MTRLTTVFTLISPSLFDNIMCLNWAEVLGFFGKLLLLLVSGFLLGEERERSNKVIGTRSTLLVLLGAFMFTYISTKIGGDRARIVAQVVTGVGFIGAGIIFKHSASEILNLTTAIFIWALSAIGCMIALGLMLESVILVLLIYVILKSNQPEKHEEEDINLEE